MEQFVWMCERKRQSEKREQKRSERRMLNAARFSREHIKRIPVMKLFSRWIHTSQQKKTNDERKERMKNQRAKKKQRTRRGIYRIRVFGWLSMIFRPFLPIKNLPWISTLSKRITPHEIPIFLIQMREILFAKIEKFSTNARNEK